MAAKQRKLISFDWAIKKILRSKANFAVLEGFLSELLQDDITIQKLLELEFDEEFENDNLNCLDIKVKNSKSEVVLIRIQCDRHLNYMQRIFHATSKKVIEPKEVEVFFEIAKVISIIIVYFDLGGGDDYIYQGVTSFIGKHNQQKLELNDFQAGLYKIKVADIQPEYYFVRVNDFDNDVKDAVDEWIYFLKNEDIKDDFKAKGLQKAKEVLDYSTAFNQTRQEYQSHRESLHYQASMYESTYVVGKMDGKKEGKMEGKVETLIVLLESRFGELTIGQKEKINLLGEEKFNQILKKLWIVQGLQDLF